VTVDNGIAHYFPTDYGLILMHMVFVEHPIWRYVYNDLNKVAMESQVYKSYCKETYGVDLCQLGQVTRNQLNKLVEVYEGDGDSVVLEPGCGTGHIAEYLQERIGAVYRGFDLSDYAIDCANLRNETGRAELHFEANNIYTLDYDENSFDSIIAIDSLHYLLGLTEVIKGLKKIVKPGGILYTFWESWIPNEASLEMERPEATRLGKVLRELDLKYESWDFSEDNKRAWNDTVKNLERYKDAFYEEGSELVYESRFSETSRIDNSVSSSRFLYKIYLG